MIKLSKLSINRFLYSTIFFIIVLFAILLSAVLINNLEQLRKDALANFAFRSELFKDGIDSNIVLGDYVSSLKKAELFFSQNDVEVLRITLVDGTSLVNMQKNSKVKEWFDVSKKVTIADDSSSDVSLIANIQIAYDLSPLDSILKAIIWQGATVLLIFLGAAGIGAFYLSKLLNQPLKRLSGLVSGGDLQKISSIKKESKILELGMLESAIASMGEQLTSFHKKELENAKSLAVAQVATQISHDLRAPLANIERLLYLPLESTIQSQEKVIKESLFRINSMIDSFRNTDTELLVTAIPIILNFSESFSGLQAKADLKGISLTIDDQAKYRMLRIDSQKMERAIANLVSNAIDASRRQVSLKLSFKERDLVCTVSDDGSGVADEFLPKLFQRGATHGKADGTGLGLAYVRQIMRGHGGDVAYRRENGLTIFECRLPNAVEPGKDQVVENAASLEIQLVQKLVRTVAICLEPGSLSRSVLTKLASYKSDGFLFIEERRESNIVVSNVEEIMFEVLETDEQEFISVSQLKCDEIRIVELLKRKFNLV